MVRSDTTLVHLPGSEILTATDSATVCAKKRSPTEHVDVLALDEGRLLPHLNVSS